VPTSILANPGTVEKAIAAVANSYESLQVATGYRYTIKRVYRHLLPEDSLGGVETPAVFVIRPPGTTGTIEWYDERAYRETLRVDVLAFLKGDGRNPEAQGLATMAEALLSDLKKLAMADPQFGLGPAGEIKNSRIVADSNDAGWDSSTAVVGIGLELTVYFDGINP